VGDGEVSCIVSRPDGCKRLAAQHLQFAMAQTATDRLGEVKVRAWLWKLTIRPGLAHGCRHTHTHTHIYIGETTATSLSVGADHRSDRELDGQLVAYRPDDGQHQLTGGELRRRRRLAPVARGCRGGGSG